MIYLCRHGQTEFNKERRLQGRRESALTPLGEAQAAAMGRRLSSLIGAERAPLWRIIASPLGRTLQTAKAIASCLRLPISTDDRLLEISVGDWEGRLAEEVFQERPELREDPEWLDRAPGGEGFEAVIARGSAFLEDHGGASATGLIIVGHGLAGRLLRGIYAGLPRAAALAQDAPQDAIFRLADGRIERLSCASF